MRKYLASYNFLLALSIKQALEIFYYLFYPNTHLSTWKRKREVSFLKKNMICSVNDIGWVPPFLVQLAIKSLRILL